MPLHRIAVILYHNCPLAAQEGKETGGAEIYTLEISKALARSGVDVDIFTRAQDPSNPFLVEIEPHLRLFHLAAGPQKMIPKKELLPYVDEFVSRFFTFVEAEKVTYDVLYCHYYTAGLVGTKIQAKYHWPIVFTYHTLALLKNFVARNTEELVTKERMEIEFMLAKKVDRIIAASPNDADYLHYLYEVPTAKTKVIPPGVNLQLFQPMDQKVAKKEIGADEDHKIVLFVGRIEPLKGIDGLIYAMKILLQKNPQQHVCLWIVGGDISQKPEEWSPELIKLEELRKLLDIHTSVKFAGIQSQERLRYYYNAAEVVVLPSHYESFGMAAAEAMACGTPVIMTNVAGISRLLDAKHQELLTTVNNPLLLASQIEHVLNNPEPHEATAHELMKKVQDLSWENIASQVKKVLSEVSS